MSGDKRGTTFYFLQKFFLLIVLAAVVVSVSNFEDCDKWASQDGECINNPNFMWTQCSSSCRSIAKDDNEKCSVWAEEGECTANPHYIQVHCPESCGFSVFWNPYIRRDLEFDALPLPSPADAPEANFLANSSSCKVVDLMQVADLMKLRADLYIRRAGATLPSSTLGLSSTSPTEFLGIYGVAEAFLYSLRVYHYIVVSSATQGSAQAEAASSARLEGLLNTIKSGWSADPLARYLATHGIQALEEASVAARAAVGLPADDQQLQPNTCPATGEPRPPISALNAALESSYPKGYEPLLKPLLPFIAPSSKKLFPFAPLRSGINMPLLGLGTWQLDGGSAEDIVYNAIKLGYRHIDCAEAYGNEASVGKGIRRALADGLVKREELFIASKVSSEQSGGAGTSRLVKGQMSQLGIDYFDMYYLHSPMQDQNLQARTWSELEKLVDAGLIRDLAVSNFDSPTLAFFDGKDIKVQPSVIQNKVDIYHHGKQLDNQGEDVMREAAKRGIIMLAYSPFSSYPFSLMPTEDPVVRSIAQSLHPIPLTVAAEVLPFDTLADIYDLAGGVIPITPAMVIIKWAAQLGMAQIPRSKDPQRMAENLIAASAAMFDLDEDHVRLLSNLQLLTTSPLCVSV